MLEAENPAQWHFPPRFGYQYFSETVDPVTRECVGYVPVEREVFATGAVVFEANDRVHDIGAGPGDSTEYLIGTAKACIRDSIGWIASEPNLPDCKVMKIRFASKVEVLNLDAVEAVERVGECDKIFFINGIHLLSPEERALFIKKSYISLKPQGQLIAPTTFIQEGVNDDVQRQVLIPWMEVLFNEARDLGIDRRAMINRMKEVKAQTWSAERYKVEFENAGFNLQVFEICEMPCTWESYRTISHFLPFVRNIFPDEVPDRTAAVISITALKRAMRRLGKRWEDPAPRNTLVVVARKPFDISFSSDSNTGAIAPIERELVLV